MTQRSIKPISRALAILSIVFGASAAFSCAPYYLYYTQFTDTFLIAVGVFVAAGAVIFGAGVISFTMLDKD